VRCTEHVHPIADATSAIVRSDRQYARRYGELESTGCAARP